MGKKGNKPTGSGKGNPSSLTVEWNNQAFETSCAHSGGKVKMENTGPQCEKNGQITLLGPRVEGPG